MTTIRRTQTKLALLAVALIAPGARALADADPNRGLWVGEVTLRHVNEVTVPLDENNNPVAPRPEVPTPTSDAANLRILLHVNGAGQVNLLKEAAILSRKDSVLRSENDLALVTDERLYGQFPPQPAVRMATAGFDYGDPRATRAVTEVVDAAVDSVYQSVSGLSLASLDTVGEREAAADAAFSAANLSSVVPAVIPTADAAVAFFNFRTAELTSATIDQIAAAPDPDLFVGLVTDSNSLRGKAKGLEDSSFYGDTRALEMLDAIVDALEEATSSSLEDRERIAQGVASSFADLTNEYQRFLAGETFGDMIGGAADAAADAGKVQSPAAVEAYAGTVGVAPTTVTSIGHALENGDRIVLAGASEAALNGTHEVTIVDADQFSIPVIFESAFDIEPRGSWVRFDPIDSAARTAPGVIAANAEVSSVQVAEYRDTRASAAVETVLSALIDGAAVAATELPGASEDTRASRIAAAAETAARQALETVPRYAQSAATPSTDYTDFVRSDAYRDSPALAARAAADAAVFEKGTNILATEGSIRAKARAAALQALDAVFSAAARVTKTELPMTGALGAGLAGDPEAGEPSALETELVLAANHPTNPFRHRRHPDHTVGFEITRLIKLDFDDADPSPSPRAGFGVDRLTGVYREEIFGLHKGLGPDPEEPVGLRVEGTFEIQRVSLIDTLNAR